MCFICPSGDEFSNLIFLWLIPTILGLIGIVRVSSHRPRLVWIISIISVILIVLIYRKLSFIAVPFLSVIPIAWLCAVFIVFDKKWVYSKSIIIIILVYHPIPIYTELNRKYKEYQKEIVSQRNVERQIEALKTFCGNSEKQRPPFAQAAYRSLHEPVDVYIRYGKTLYKSDDSSKIYYDPAGDLPNDFLRYLSHQYDIGKHGSYPAIRCFENENKYLGLFYPSSYCPNYTKDSSKNATSPTSQSRFHLIVGEDNPLRIIIQKLDWIERKDTQMIMELHTIRMIDTKTEKTIGEMPVVFSAYTHRDVNPLAFGCADPHDVMKNLLEYTLIPPEQRGKMK